MEDKIKELISDEISNAVLKHGEFNSEHEAYSVIMEELEELEEELIDIRMYFDAIWPIIRGQEPISGLETLEKISVFGTRKSIKLIEEAIQVAAMFSKLKDIKSENKTVESPVDVAIREGAIVDLKDGNILIPMSASGVGQKMTREEYNEKVGNPAKA
jgi:hypothetical protein